MEGKTDLGKCKLSTVCCCLSVVSRLVVYSLLMNDYHVYMYLLVI